MPAKKVNGELIKTHIMNNAQMIRLLRGVPVLKRIGFAMAYQRSTDMKACK
jgi:hypothetical protein